MDRESLDLTMVKLQCIKRLAFLSRMTASCLGKDWLCRFVVTVYAICLSLATQASLRISSASRPKTLKACFIKSNFIALLEASTMYGSTALVATATVLIVLGVSATCLRFYVRLKLKPDRIGVDDWLILVACTLMVGQVVNQIYLGE